MFIIFESSKKEEWFFSSQTSEKNINAPLLALIKSIY
jgi:hypothetical protein